jgi:hypothetical protein
MKLNFFDRFSRHAQMSSFIKIRPVGAEFHAGWTDEQTDLKLIVAFRSLRTRLERDVEGCKDTNWIELAQVMF